MLLKFYIVLLSMTKKIRNKKRKYYVNKMKKNILEESFRISVD